jgi:hypothetical protein
MSRQYCLFTITLVLAIAKSCVAQSAMQPWLTRSADNSRSGWNPNETELTQSSVLAKGIVRATIIPLVGDARGMEAQPLILPNVPTARGTRDVLVLPSMANVVRGVDAHDGSGIWQTPLGTPINSSTQIDSKNINQHWGCISPGVIDPDTRRLDQVCWVSTNNSGDPTQPTARYFMHVLNVTDGTLVVPPVQIQGTSGKQDFNAQMRKQRSSLVETSVNGEKTVFGCTGTIFETGDGADGFCFAFDVATNKMGPMLAMTAGEGAGIWMGGQGAAADPQGFLYVLTCNGDFDGKTQFGESFLKLQYTPASDGTPASLQIVDHRTPWTDFGRTGQKMPTAVRLAGASAVSEAVRRPVNAGMRISLENATTRVAQPAKGRGIPAVLVIPAMASGNWSDEDWGSAGPACIFSIGVCIATGKDGIG